MLLEIDPITFQVVTILKDTTKLVKDVPFPALTICGSGIHMNDVEKKLIQDFKDWRKERNRTQNNKQAVRKDTEEFMQIRFQIEPGKTENEEPINILDMLDMMIAPNVDASAAANSVRENIIACKPSQDAPENKMDCSTSCPDTRFKMFENSKCFHVSATTTNYADAVTACQAMGAELASINNKVEDDHVWSLGLGENMWIGLNDQKKEGTWVWQDGTEPTYTNWIQGVMGLGADPNGKRAENCGGKANYVGANGKWADDKCSQMKKYACRMEAEESCDSSKALKDVLQRRVCVQPRKDKSPLALPGIDVFVNPGRVEEKKQIIRHCQELLQEE